MTFTATSYGTSIDRISRSIIFLVSNNLINREQVTLKLPPYHNVNIIDQIKSLINENFTIKDIKKKHKLTKNEMLFYWFKAEIKICYIERNQSNCEEYVQLIINNLNTIKRFC